MLQRLRESLALALIGLLPFHALLLTVATRLLRGPGHAPIAVLAAWKEGVLAAILFLALAEIAVSFGGGKGQEARRSFRERFDLIDRLILALFVLSAFVSLFAVQPGLRSVVYGFKYDFIPLIAFLLLRRVEWSEVFVRRVNRVLLAAGGLVATYGILTFVLPDRFFALLGYSDQHSLYFADRAIAAFQQIGGSAVRRVQGTLSGPNQLGLWLLLPWTLSLIGCLRTFLARRGMRPRLLAIFLVCSAALLLTFSRSAWIAALVILLAALLRLLPRRSFSMVVAGLLGIGVLLAAAAFLWDPAVFLRLSSNRGHIERPLAAVRMIAERPLGYGLGAAGPASNHLHEACVFLLPGDDPSWAKPLTNLCVYVGDKQVQPIARACDCPFLPENWYLQIGVELGVPGMALYIALTVLLLWRLGHGRWKREDGSMPADSSDFRLATFLAFLGVSIAALFLHAWEDAAAAYTLWLLAASAVRERR